MSSFFGFGQNNTASGTPAGTAGTTGAFGGGGNLFGSSTPAAGTTGPGTTGGNLFGNTATSGTTGNTSAFGGGGNMFGAKPPGTTTTTGTAATPASGGGLFGSTAPSITTPVATTPGGNMFGNAAASGTGGLFGSGSTTAAAPTAPSGGLFGSTAPASGSMTSTAPAAGGLFGSKPAEAPKANPLFGGTPTTIPSASSTTPAAGAGLFGATKPADSTTLTAPAAPAAGSLFGGGLFGKKPDAPASGTAATPAATTGTATAPAAPAAASMFSGFGAKPADKPEEKKDGVAATPATNLFGAASASTEKKDAPAASTTALTFGAKPADAAVSTIATTGATAVASNPPSMLRGKTVDEIVTKWATDLDNHVRDFNTYASEVASWDRALIQNGNNLSALTNMVLAAEREQNEIDQALDHIEQQQRDLSATLDVYEKSAEEVLGGQGGSLRALDTGPADTERDKNYVLATELHSQLQDLSGSLAQMIDSVNALSVTENTSNEDPMTQIVQILSSHLESLQWIDGAVHDIETKVGDVEKRVRDAGGANALGSSVRNGYGLRQ